jgi:hypothetical protein
MVQLHLGPPLLAVLAMAIRDGLFDCRATRDGLGPPDIAPGDKLTGP